MESSTATKQEKWSKLTDWQRFAAVMAYTVAPRDPMLAIDIRSVLELSLRGELAECPGDAVTWDEGITP